MSESLALEGTLHLVVAWASGKSYVARLVKMSDEVAEALKSYAEMAVEGLSHPVPYAPDADIEDDSHMEAPRDESIDIALISELAKGASLDLATEDELRTKPLKCHALVVSSDATTILFVRKRSPVKLARKSLLAAIFNGSLNELESPVFAFDNKYDAIITAEKVYVLDKKAFDGLFKDSPAVSAKTTEWVKEVSEAVSFTEGSAEVLDKVLKRNSVLRNKFLAVREKPYLESITSDTLRTEIIRYGYEPSELMEEGSLKVNEQNVKTVLRLLNEDFFTGGFSQQHYAASSKRSISLGLSRGG